LRDGLDFQVADEVWPEPNGHQHRHEARGSMGSIVLLDLMGGVALLLWGLHMVRSGIMRAFGSELRRVLSTALRNRFLALLAGIGVTAHLQSSTATGLLMTSFAARGARHSIHSATF
jgi:hypothetical protein